MHILNEMNTVVGIKDETFEGTYPFAPHYVKINGFQIHYVDEGCGEPIVLLHGDPTWGYLYRHFIPSLSRLKRCIVPDHIGMGKSGKPSKEIPHRLRHHISHFEMFVKTLNLCEITLVLHDWGGPVGLGFAVRNPERIKRIVLLNTWAFAKWPGGSFPRLLEVVRSGKGEKFVLEKNGYLEAVIGGIALSAGNESDILTRAYRAPFPTPESRYPLLWWTRDIPVTSCDPSYEDFRYIENRLFLFKGTPVLIVWGMKDQVLPPSVLLEWGKTYPAANILSIENAGHFLQEDEPQRVVEAIIEFIMANP